MGQQVYFKYFVHPEEDIKFKLPDVTIDKNPCKSHVYNSLPLLVGYQYGTDRIFLSKNIQPNKVKQYVDNLITEKGFLLA